MTTKFQNIRPSSKRESKKPAFNPYLNTYIHPLESEKARDKLKVFLERAVIAL